MIAVLDVLARSADCKATLQYQIGVQQWIIAALMGTLCTSQLKPNLNADTRSQRRSRPGLVGCGRTKNHRHTHMHSHAPFFLTHQQGCVTASKIRLVAPGCPPLFHGGPLASSTTPFRQRPNVSPPPSGLGLQPDTGIQAGTGAQTHV